MTTLPEHVLAEAFALSNARGADLLARLGSFNVWRGDLATMRDDNPRAPMPSSEPEDARPMRVSADALVLAEAIERLQPRCRAALAAVYVDHKDPSAVAAALDTEPADAQRIKAGCEQRLREIYDALEKESPSDAAAVPAGGSRPR
jgi:hypothetical protein